jgi:hypothetical protein
VLPQLFPLVQHSDPPGGRIPAWPAEQHARYCGDPGWSAVPEPTAGGQIPPACSHGLPAAQHTGWFEFSATQSPAQHCAFVALQQPLTHGVWLGAQVGFWQPPSWQLPGVQQV